MDRGGEVGGAAALRTKRPEQAAIVDSRARTAPRRGRTFRQGHRLTKHCHRQNPRDRENPGKCWLGETCDQCIGL